MRMQCAAVKLRTRLFHLPYGDQGLLVSAGLFRHVPAVVELLGIQDR